MNSLSAKSEIAVFNAYDFTQYQRKCFAGMLPILSGTGGSNDNNTY